LLFCYVFEEHVSNINWRAVYTDNVFTSSTHILPVIHNLRGISHYRLSFAGNNHMNFVRIRIRPTLYQCSLIYSFVQKLLMRQIELIWEEDGEKSIRP
jgi:hypothetical protein